MSSKQSKPSRHHRSWWPTNKWMAAQCTALATFAVAWVNAGTWNRPLTIAAIGLVSQATAAYLVSNADPAAAEANEPAAGTATSPASGSASGSASAPVGVPATVA
jgi:hypothetical protein